MKGRQVLIARYGPADVDAVAIDPQEHATEIQLVSGAKRLGHGIGSILDDAAKNGLLVTEVAVDLILLAVLVYAADTQISRTLTSQDSWTREVRLVLPVDDVGLWNANSELLSTMLDFLTGDLWKLEFRARPAGFEVVGQPLPNETEASTYDGVSLFSGGMDSLIGAIDELSDGSRPLLVGHAGEAATSDAQRACLEHLRAAFAGQPFGWLRAWLQFDHDLFPGLGGENTTRARSFLFFALGVFAGSGLGKAFVLRVPENGLIALNVPLDQSRLGALSTRTTHPFYMARWQDLVSGLGISATIQNPFWNLTKGEMVAQCRNLAALILTLPSCMSCSSPAKARWKGYRTQHCGYCLPCIIRRAALLHGLPPGVVDPTPYTLADLAAGPLKTSRSEGKQIRSFQVALERLRSNPDSARFLIHKSGPLSDLSDQTNEYAGVYSRGMAEVGELLKGVVTSPK